MPKRRILLVEDDADTRRGLELRLGAWGYHTAAAADSVSALAAARTLHPDLVLLDLGLPGGDGLLILERLQAMTTTATIPVVVLTARDPGHSRERAMQLGAVAFLQKPAENEELKAVIESHMPAAGTEAAIASRLKVLLVEDDADTRQGLTLRLRAEGYDVAVAADASTAMTAALRERPHAVILDLGLPGGEGLAVLRRLKAVPALAPVPVLVLTARAAEAARDEVLGAGAAAFLQKPAENAELLETLRRMCGGPGRQT